VRYAGKRIGAVFGGFGKIYRADPVLHHEKHIERSWAVEISARAQAIENALCDKLEAQHVAVIDQSSLHESHLGAQSGGGHFQVLVVSDRFRGLSRLASQRVVYEALGDLMLNDIHALSMRTLTPEEWSG
jgi:BolA protein